MAGKRKEGKRLANVLSMKPRSYKAQLFTAKWETKYFRMSGTLDGFIDFVVPGGKTLPLSLDEAKGLVAAINGAVADVEKNCLHESDELLIS
jgi:hypothetical protein